MISRALLKTAVAVALRLASTARQAVVGIASVVARETPLLGGFASITYGAWLWSHPLGYVAGGVLAVFYRILWELPQIAAAKQVEPK